MTISNFKQTKIDLDVMFNDNWTLTPIHWSGVSFDSTDKSQWINVVYEPLSNRTNGLGGRSNVSNGMLYVVCWAEDEFNVMDIADQVVLLVSNNMPLFITNIDHDVVDRGFDENGKAYMVLGFPIKSYIGDKCVPEDVIIYIKDNNDKIGYDIFNVPSTI